MRFCVVLVLACMLVVFVVWLCFSLLRPVCVLCVCVLFCVVRVVVVVSLLLLLLLLLLCFGGCVSFALLDCIVLGVVLRGCLVVA